MEKERKFPEGNVSERIARRLRDIRKKRGLQQQALADICGMSNQTICNIERGRHDFMVGTLDALEKALGFRVVLILEEDL